MRGAHSEQACRDVLPDHEVLPRKMFEDVFAAVEKGEADVGMVPVENSMAGLVTDSYDLLAVHNLHIVGEYYLRVRHCLLGLPEATLEGITQVYSHPQALAQCQALIRARGWTRHSIYDTAGAAADLRTWEDPRRGAIASELCSELYSLRILQRDIQDSQMNTTRFLLVANHPVAPPAEIPCKTSLLFEVRHIPAALYKCLGGFATNNVNLTRLESRPVPGMNWAYHFYLDFQGRPEDTNCKLALEELNFFTTSLKTLGCYPRSPRPEEPVAS